MSYAHTKRRKTIAKFKREGGNWGLRFRQHCDKIRKQLDGPLIGSLESLMKIGENK